MKRIMLLMVISLFLFSCSDTMRFPPSENQKQSAYLGYRSNAEICTKGTEPKSVDAVTALQSSQASLSYIGMPQTIPSIEAASAINQAAIVEGSKRPTTQESVDYWITIGAGIAGLVLAGTPLGLKVSSVASQLKDVSARYSATKAGVNKTLAESPPEQSKVLYKNIGEEREKAGIV